ncbi:MAG: hypothetical protein SD837_14165 [Candidatus Electrothrix scaldis]|nr:MAG: hypothetical protein SD837_14165 [Candidatus Electrothrix sp. GW3-3]
MNDEIKIYLELAPELQQALDDNGISISDILREAGIDARLSHDVLPLQNEAGVQSRDLKQVITLLVGGALAGSALIGTIGFTVSKTLNTVYNKPIHVEYQEPVELRNADGNVVLDKQGNPVFKLVTRHQILQPQQSNKDAFMADLKKMVLSISSEKNAQ